MTNLYEGHRWWRDGNDLCVETEKYADRLRAYHENLAGKVRAYNTMKSLEPGDIQVFVAVRCTPPELRVWVVETPTRVLVLRESDRWAAVDSPTAT